MVWAALGRHQVLLVLDSAEDCTDPALYTDWLNRLNLNGGTRVLLTNRHRWADLRDTWHHELTTPSCQTATDIVRMMAEKVHSAYSLVGYEQHIAKAAHYRPKLMWYAIRWANVYPPDYVLELLKSFDGIDADEAREDLVARISA